ncbi:unnamed protein product, partial [Tetraodon nigroviridis]
MDFPMYVYKARRAMKRGDESKETYKLPHRLIEKKRRDRINECIAQLKDLLPEHLKLTTLGHLEKAVVLELTLKHVKALSSVLEQQQQKIVALQQDLQISDHRGDGAESSEEMFRSGFHLCAKEVLEYVSSQESSGDLTPSHVMGHIQKVAAELLHQRRSSRRPDQPAARPPEKPAAPPPKAADGPAKNCVPVIQRTSAHGIGEQSGSDTDTDSGYGGEHDKRDPKAQWTQRHAKEGGLGKRPGPEGGIKQEGDEAQAKKSRCGFPEEELLPGHVAGDGSYAGFSPSQTPFCLPFYFLPPASAPVAAYLPMLEKCWYPGSMPVLYQGVSSPGACLSPEALGSSRVVSPRAGSPAPRHDAADSPALHKALKHIPPLNLETRD